MRLVLASMLVAGCSGGSDITPTISITMVTPESITASDDTLDDVTIRVHYDDGDGDLGGGTATIHDCRADALVTTLDLPMIAPASKHDAISGELDLYVDDVGDQPAAAMPSACSDLGVATLAAGTTVFCVELGDDAGHTSVGACTDAITIVE